MKNILYRLFTLSLTITCLLAGAAGVSGAAEAGGTKEPKLWPDKVKVGGEFRTRLEARINDDLNSAASDDDTFVLLRTRIYLDLNPMSYVRLYAMFQDSETLGQNTSALIKTPDRHKFYQGWVFLKNAGPFSTSLKMGRQEFVYGDARLVGNNNWNNLGRSFDGAVVRLENSDFWLDLFGSRIHPNGKENQFAGAYAQWKKFPQGELEAYALYLHGSKSGLGNGSLSIATIGSRIKGKFKKNYDYGFEGAYQTGDSAGNLVSAFATHLHLGYTFPLSFKPRVGIEYNFASGDDNPKTGTVTTFNNLFPTNHDKYGYMDLFSWKNLHDFRFSFDTQPLEWFKTKLDYHAFLLPDPANGVFLANGTQYRAGVPGASHFAGQELDLLFTFKPWKYVDALVGYSVFFPGAFFKDTGSSDTSQFFYTQVSWHY
ncbi:MAG: alginate export family protein [bacterium]